MTSVVVFGFALHFAAKQHSEDVIRAPSRGPPAPSHPFDHGSQLPAVGPKALTASAKPHATRSTARLQLCGTAGSQLRAATRNGPWNSELKAVCHPSRTEFASCQLGVPMYFRQRNHRLLASHRGALPARSRVPPIQHGAFLFSSKERTPNLTVGGMNLVCRDSEQPCVVALVAVSQQGNAGAMRLDRRHNSNFANHRCCRKAWCMSHEGKGQLHPAGTTAIGHRSCLTLGAKFYTTNSKYNIATTLLISRFNIDDITGTIAI